MKSIAVIFVFSWFLLSLSCQQQNNAEVDELNQEIVSLQKWVQALEQEAALKALSPVKSTSSRKKTNNPHWQE